MRRSPSRQPSPRGKDFNVKSSYGSPNSPTKTPHPLLSLYRDKTENSAPVDVFAPYLTRKLANRSALQRSSKKEIPELGTAPPSPKATPPVESNTPTVPQYIEMEQVFDSIAAGALKQGLNQATEVNFKSYFRCETVTFFYDVPSIQLLYSPSTALVYPHGSGLVGYCHFTKNLLNIQTASSHVQFDKNYDGKNYNEDSHVLIFPIFDSDNRLVAVIKMTKPPNSPQFDKYDEMRIKYFQSKFQTYSAYLFDYSLKDVNISELVAVHRLGPFIESVQETLTKLFYCRKIELWEMDTNTQDTIELSSDLKKQRKMKVQQAGIVGHCLSTRGIISLVSADTHSAFNKKIDGNSEHSVIAVPVSDPKSNKVYAICLRGKRIPYFFTEKDESLLRQIAPIVVTALQSSEMIEQYLQEIDDCKRAESRQDTILEVAKSLSGQLHIEELVPNVMSRACELVNADRCSLFLVDENRERLVTSFHGGLKEAIEVPINSGIVGLCATSGKIVNIPSAYDDPRFNRATDIKTGYRTHTLLCVPIFDQKGRVRGVTEMVNKQDMGGFTADDEKMIELFNIFTGISIENARLYRASIELSLQLRSVIEISQSISQATENKRILMNIIKNARKVIGAGRSMIYLHDAKEKRSEIYALDEDIEAKAIQATEKAPKGPSYTKKTFIRKMIFDEDAPAVEENDTEDPDRQSYVSRAILARESHFANRENPYQSMAVVPIVGSNRTTMGAFLMQWKKRNTLFTEEDVRLMEAFAVFISIAMERSKMAEQVTYGPLELALRQNMTESERLAVSIPVKLEMHQSELEKASSIGFCAYEWGDIGIYKMCFWIFEKLGIRKAYHISNETLFSFLFKLEESYKDCQYQNWRRAIQMAQLMVHIVSAGQNADMFTAFDKFALLITILACNAGADDVHRTRNKVNCIPLSVLFENKSVHEKHRAAMLIEIISDEQSNIFAALKADELRSMWEHIIALMSASDMSNHFDIMEKIEQLARDDDAWFESKENKMTVMQLLVKLLDVSDMMRPPEYADSVKNYVAQKFFDFGDLSKCYGVTYRGENQVRERIDYRASRNAFVNYVVIPLLIRAASVFPVLAIGVEQARQTAKRWVEKPGMDFTGDRRRSSMAEIDNSVTDFEL